MTRMRRGIGLRAARSLALVAAATLAVQLPAAALLSAPAIAASSTSTGTSTTPVVPALPDTTSPFSPGVPLSGNTGTPTATTPTVLQTTTSSSSGGLSGTGALFIAAGAIVVLGGIAYFIWADSRRHAPAGTAPSRESATQRAGSKTPPKSRKLSPAERRRRKRGRAR